MSKRGLVSGSISTDKSSGLRTVRLGMLVGDTKIGTAAVYSTTDRNQSVDRNMIPAHYLGKGFRDLAQWIEEQTGD